MYLTFDKQIEVMDINYFYLHEWVFEETGVGYKMEKLIPKY